MALKLTITQLHAINKVLESIFEILAKTEFKCFYGIIVFSYDKMFITLTEIITKWL